MWTLTNGVIEAAEQLEQAVADVMQAPVCEPKRMRRIETIITAPAMPKYTTEPAPELAHLDPVTHRRQSSHTVLSHPSTPPPQQPPAAHHSPPDVQPQPVAESMQPAVAAPEQEHQDLFNSHANRHQLSKCCWSALQCLMYPFKAGWQFVSCELSFLSVPIQHILMLPFWHNLVVLSTHTLPEAFSSWQGKSLHFYCQQMTN